MSADRALYGALEGKAAVEDVNKALLELCRYAPPQPLGLGLMGVR